MKNFFKKTTPFFLSLTAACLLMGANNASAQTNTGIWDTYILLGAAPNTFFVGGTHTQHPNAVAFNNLNLGNLPVNGTFNLAGGQDFTAKVTAHANICSGKLIYSVYPATGSPTTWDTVALN